MYLKLVFEATDKICRDMQFIFVINKRICSESEYHGWGIPRINMLVEWEREFEFPDEHFCMDFVCLKQEKSGEIIEWWKFRIACSQTNFRRFHLSSEPETVFVYNLIFWNSCYHAWTLSKIIENRAFIWNGNSLDNYDADAWNL